MATTGRTVIEVGFTFEDDDVIAAVKQSVNTRADSKIDYANGTGANSVTRVHSSRRTLTAASGTDDIDLTLITDPENVRIQFSLIRYIYIKNREPITGSNLLIGGAASLPWTAPFNGSVTAKTTVAPGGEWFLSSPIDGLAVTAGSRILRIENDGGSSGDLDFDLIIAGEE